MEQLKFQFRLSARQDEKTLPLLNYYLDYLPVNIGTSLKNRFQHHNCNLEFATWVNTIQIRNCIRQARKLGFTTWVSIDQDRAFLYGSTLVDTEKKKKSAINWLKTITRKGSYGHALFNYPERHKQLIRINSSLD